MKTFVQNIKCSVISSVFSKENNWLCSWVGSQWGISCCSVAHLSTPEGLDLSSTDMMHVIIRNVQQFVRWLLPSFPSFSIPYVFLFLSFFLHLQSIFSVSVHLILHDAFWGFFDLNFFLSFFLFFPSPPPSLVGFFVLPVRAAAWSQPPWSRLSEVAGSFITLWNNDHAVIKLIRFHEYLKGETKLLIKYLLVVSFLTDGEMVSHLPHDWLYCTAARHSYQSCNYAFITISFNYVLVGYYLHRMVDLL